MLLEIENDIRLEDASLLLAAVSNSGITGLCHPTSDQYAPAFPKCHRMECSTGVYATASSTLTSTKATPMQSSRSEALQANAQTQQQTRLSGMGMSRNLEDATDDDNAEQSDNKKWGTYYGFDDDAYKNVEIEIVVQKSE